MAEAPGLFWLQAALYVTPWWAWAAGAAVLIPASIAIWRA
jgi:hypothetical protein